MSGDPARPAGLVLAAGAGRRMGTPKALLRLPDGRLLVDRAVDALVEGGCDPVVVVLGAEAEEVRRTARLSTGFHRDGVVHSRVNTVDNSDWQTGMGTSLRCGLAALPASAPAVVILLVDTPGVGAAAVARMATHATPDRVAMGTHSGRRSHPVVIGRELWPDVASAAVGDVGARPFLAAHPELVTEVECDDLLTPEDLDTLDEWTGWLRRQSQT